MSDKKNWDWTIEAGEKGFYFIEFGVPSFEEGRFTRPEVDMAYSEFLKIDNPEINRTRQEGRDLIDKITTTIKNNVT